jgi:K+-transporting ATPase KdpF subunit
MHTSAGEIIFSCSSSATTFNSEIPGNVRRNFYRRHRRIFSTGFGLSERLRSSAERGVEQMSWDIVLATICAALLLIYLTYALLRPEKF